MIWRGGGFVSTQERVYSAAEKNFLSSMKLRRKHKNALKQGQKWISSPLLHTSTVSTSRFEDGEFWLGSQESRLSKRHAQPWRNGQQTFHSCRSQRLLPAFSCLMLEYMHICVYICIHVRAYSHWHDLIWFVFIGSSTETAVNPSRFYISWLPLEFESLAWSIYALYIMHISIYVCNLYFASHMRNKWRSNGQGASIL